MRGADLVVEVQDDGRGLAASPERAGGVGLPSMRDRAAEIGGRLELGTGADGRGMLVRAVLPAGAP